MADGLNRFLGDTPGRTLVKLIVVSLIVGFVMSVFGLDPADLLNGVRYFLIDLWYTGFDALGRVGQYLLIGATVVIPAFILLRLFASRN
jgi:succinate dehydrogenase/fumarate reductase cytochrome b subunit